MIIDNSHGTAQSPRPSIRTTEPGSQSLAKIYERLGTLKKPIAALILVTISLLVYWPVMFHEFQQSWDDQWVAINQYTERGLEPSNLWNILTEFYHGQYAPVNELYYTCLYTLFGYDPFWYHLAGLCIHLVNVGLLFYFMESLQRMAGIEPGKAMRIAFFTAILTALHPFLVESVAWISASKIILYVMFYLLSLISYLRYLGQKTIGNYCLVLLCFVLSFGAKEQAVVLPVCLLLLDYVTGRSMRSEQLWLEKAPFFILALFFGVLTFLSQKANGEGLLVNGGIKYPFYQNIVFACYALSEYLSKCFIPIKLSYLYPFPIQPGEQLPVRFWIYPVLTLLGTVLLRNFWKGKWIFFGIAFFVIHIAIALHLVPIARFTIVADRYVYLSAIGVFFLTASFLEYAFRKDYKIWAIIGMLLYLILLGTYAHQRVRTWRNTDTLKKELRDVLQKRNDIQQINKKINNH